MSITKTQKQTKEFLISFQRTRGYKPTLFDVMRRFKLSSTASAWERVHKVIGNNEIKIIKLDSKTGKRLEKIVFVSGERVKYKIV